MSTASPELSEIVVAAQEIEFWRKACPSLRLSDLYQAPAPPADLSESELEGLARDLGQEGYFITRELIQASARAELLGLVDQVVARGLNPTWAMIFDPFWDTFARLGGLLEHLLGEDYRYVTGDYVFIVENTDQAAGWGKHRDLQFRRSMSRNAALKRWHGRQLVDELAGRGIIIRTRSMRGVAEEAPGAYKDVEVVAEATERAGLARRVALLRPMICIKG